jgi:hypothetical protein
MVGWVIYENWSREINPTVLYVTSPNNLCRSREHCSRPHDYCATYRVNGKKIKYLFTATCL